MTQMKHNLLNLKIFLRMDFKIILLVLSLSYRFLHCNNDRWNQWKNGFSASFEIINIGRMYETLTPILHLDVYACAVECIRHLNCETINHNHKTNQCELVDQKFDETEADTSNPDWANYGTPDKSKLGVLIFLSQGRMIS